MSIVACLSTISNENIELLKKEPLLVWKVVAPEDGVYEDEIENLQKKNLGFIGRLFGSKNKPEPKYHELNLVEGEGQLSDLDKAWHAISFALTGSGDGVGHELGFLCGGGVTIGNIDVGYGPVRAFSFEEVKALQQKIALISSSEVRERLVSSELNRNDVYPGSWGDSNEDDLEYVLGYYRALVDYLSLAAKNEFGILVYYS